MARASGSVLSRRRSSAEHHARLRALVMDGAASRPGVYRMLGEDGAILYVGKSKRVRERLLGYFRQKGREKGARILRETRHIDWSYEPSEFAALRRELGLIKLHRPRFNVASMADKSHYCFVRITGDLAPKLVVHRATQGHLGGSGVFFGPFLGPDLATEAARELTDALGLRDCADTVPMHFSGDLVTLGRAPGCVRFEIQKCLGPCAAKCSAATYDEQVKLAAAFLEGTSDGPIPRFRALMDQHAKAQAYEKAALYRDKLHRLERLAAQFSRMRFSLEALSFVYPVPGAEGDDRVYLVRRGTVRAERAAPKTTADRFELARLIDAVFTPGEPATGALRVHEIDEVLLLSSWFARFPEELARTWVPG